MPRQRALDFRRERLGMLWPLFPERWRKEVLALYAQLTARAAQRPPRAQITPFEFLISARQ